MTHSIAHPAMIVLTYCAALAGWWQLMLVGVLIVLIVWRTYLVAGAGLVLDLTFAPAPAQFPFGDFPFTLLCVALATGVYLLRHHFVAPHAGPLE